MAHRSTSICVFVLALTSTAGCTLDHELASEEAGHAEPSESENLPLDTDAQPDAGAKAPAMHNPPSAAQDCGYVTDDARGTVAELCLDCHKRPADPPPHLGETIESLVREGFVVPYQPDRSPLLSSIDGGTMPPGAAPDFYPGLAANLRRWIECGAPQWSCQAAGCPDDDVIRLSAKGVRAFPDPYASAEAEACVNEVCIVGPIELFDEATDLWVVGQAVFAENDALPWKATVRVKQGDNFLGFDASFESRDVATLQVGDEYTVTVRSSGGGMILAQGGGNLWFSEYPPNGPGCGGLCRVPTVDVYY